MEGKLTIMSSCFAAVSRLASCMLSGQTGRQAGRQADRQAGRQAGHHSPDVIKKEVTSCPNM